MMPLQTRRIVLSVLASLVALACIEKGDTNIDQRDETSNQEPDQPGDAARSDDDVPAVEASDDDNGGDDDDNGGDDDSEPNPEPAPTPEAEGEDQLLPEPTDIEEVPGTEPTVPDEADEPAVPEPDRSTNLSLLQVEYGSCTATSTGFGCVTYWTANVDTNVAFTREGYGSCDGFAYDDRGNRYATSILTIASERSEECGARDLIAGVRTLVRYDFEGVDPGATTLALLELHPGLDGVREELLLRDLPIVGGEPVEADDVEYDAAFEQGGLRFEQGRCHDAGGTLYCSLRVTSPGVERTVSFASSVGLCAGVSTTAVDDSGNEYVAARVDVANETNANDSLGCKFVIRKLARDVPTPFVYVFEEVDPDATLLARLEAWHSVDDIDEIVEFRGLPIVRD